jgi:hypothetical protein
LDTKAISAFYQQSQEIIAAKRKERRCCLQNYILSYRIHKEGLAAATSFLPIYFARSAIVSVREGLHCVLILRHRSGLQFSSYFSSRLMTSQIISGRSWKVAAKVLTS